MERTSTEDVGEVVDDAVRGGVLQDDAAVQLAPVRQMREHAKVLLDEYTQGTVTTAARGSC
jgi:hypothetical protein